MNGKSAEIFHKSLLSHSTTFYEAKLRLLSKAGCAQLTTERLFLN